MTYNVGLETALQFIRPCHMINPNTKIEVWYVLYFFFFGIQWFLRHVHKIVFVNSYFNNAVEIKCSWSSFIPRFMAENLVVYGLLWGQQVQCMCQQFVINGLDVIGSWRNVLRSNLTQARLVDIIIFGVILLQNTIGISIILAKTGVLWMT